MRYKTWLLKKKMSYAATKIGPNTILNSPKQLVNMCFEEKAIGHRTYLTEDMLRQIRNKYYERRKEEERERKLLETYREPDGSYPDWLENYLENHPYILG